MGALAWPEDLGKSFIEWDLNLMGADNWDPDRDPQLIAAKEMIVQFVPDVEQAVRYDGIEGAKTIMPMMSKGIINAEGLLCTMREDGSAGEVGVVLPATDSETMTPRDWTYRAIVTENRVRVNEFPFHAPSNGEVNLAKVAPIDRNAGTAIIVDTETADRAEAAVSDAKKYRDTTKGYRDTAKGYRDEAQTARNESQTARTGAGEFADAAAGSASTAAEILAATKALGITVDTSVGKAVYVGDTLIHYDSGWHKIESYIPPEVPLHDDFSPSVYIKRENSTVWVSFDIFRVATTIPANAPVLYIPQGFEPYSPARLGSGSTYELRSAIYTSGNELRVRDDVAGGSRRFYVSWSTGSTLPPALP